jgi:zinc D-Ala-D-Ala carboxypeptidase
VPPSRPVRPPARVLRRRRILSGTVVLAVLSGVALASGLYSGGLAPAGTPPAAAHPDAAADSEPAGTPSPRSALTRPAPTHEAPPIPVLTFNRAALSIDDPASVWVVVNKKRPLVPVNFIPPDLVEVPVAHVWSPQLRAEASAATVALFAAASAEAGLQLQSQSAYRSYDDQVSVYTAEAAAHGQAKADTDTARPGFSEHQTGLVIDISSVPAVCALQACFGDTPHGQWLSANAWRFGFLLRYPADKTAVTGYTFEPWHFRYVGTQLSTEMHATGVTTLEEFFALPPAPAY